MERGISFNKNIEALKHPHLLIPLPSRERKVERRTGNSLPLPAIYNFSLFPQLTTHNSQLITHNS
jgi:hypothetical protein